jgi:DTW domain-containing protein YfiP
VQLMKEICEICGVPEELCMCDEHDGILEE